MTVRVERGQTPWGFFRRTAAFVPTVVIGSLVLPMVVTARSFGTDWTLHLWLVRQQQWNIEALHHPGLFVSARPLGAFNPIFAFVGSGIYSAGGYLAIVLGDRPILSYKLLYAGGLGLAYGGFTWLALQRGVRGWRAQIPGLVMVTGTYFVTDLSSRGDLGEFMAVAAIPFVTAAAYAVLRSPALRIRYVLALVVGVFVFSGSHNITLLWGSVFFVVMTLAVAGALGRSWLKTLPIRRVLVIAGAAAIGVGLNAWYLFPDLAYGFDTAIAATNRARVPTVVQKNGFLFGLLRPEYPIRVTVEWTFVVWAVVFVIMHRHERDRRANRLFAAVLCVGIVFVVITGDHGAWRYLPHVLYNVQFSRRLNNYVLITTGLLVLLALERRGPQARRMPVAACALAVLALFAVVCANQQLWRVKSGYHVSGKASVFTGSSFNSTVIAARDRVPPSWYSSFDFLDVSVPHVPVTGRRELVVPLDKLHHSSFSGVLAVPDGPLPFHTNIAGGPHFVRMTGIHAVGRNPRGFVVAARDPGAPETGPIRVTIHLAHSGAIEWGRAVSIVSLLALLGVVVVPPARRYARDGRIRETTVAA